VPKLTIKATGGSNGEGGRVKVKKRQKRGVKVNESEEEYAKLGRKAVKQGSSVGVTT